MTPQQKDAEPGCDFSPEELLERCCRFLESYGKMWVGAEEDTRTIVRWLLRYKPDRGNTDDPSDLAAQEQEHREFAGEFQRSLFGVFSNYSNCQYVFGMERAPKFVEESHRGRDILSYTRDDPRLYKDPANIWKSYPSGGPSSVDKAAVYKSLDLLENALRDVIAKGPLNSGLGGLDGTRRAMTNLSGRVADNRIAPFDKLTATLKDRLAEPRTFKEGFGLAIRSVVAPGDSTTLGCLTPEMKNRLSLHYRDLASSLGIDEKEFDRGLGGIDASVEWTRKLYSKSEPEGWRHVQALCDEMIKLGEFARKLRLALVGDGTSVGIPPHRRELEFLLKNLEALGRTLVPLRDIAYDWGSWKRAPSGAAAPRGAPSVSSSLVPAPEKPGAPKLHRFEVKPPPQESYAPDDPSAVARLTRIVRGAHQSWVGEARSKTKEEPIALYHKLHQRLDDLKAGLKAEGADEARAAREQSDVLMANVQDLDVMKASRPSWCGDVAALEGTRNELFQFVKDFGGYSEYLIHEGDRASDHAGKYEEHGPPAWPTYSSKEARIIIQVFSPGYCQGKLTDPVRPAIVRVKG